MIMIGRVGRSFASDIAVDDLQLSEGSCATFTNGSDFLYSTTADTDDDGENVYMTSSSPPVLLTGRNDPSGSQEETTRRVTSEIPPTGVVFSCENNCNQSILRLDGRNAPNDGRAFVISTVQSTYTTLASPSSTLSPSELIVQSDSSTQSTPSSSASCSCLYSCQGHENCCSDFVHFCLNGSVPSDDDESRDSSYSGSTDSPEDTRNKQQEDQDENKSSTPVLESKYKSGIQTTSTTSSVSAPFFNDKLYPTEGMLSSSTSSLFSSTTSSPDQNESLINSSHGNSDESEAKTSSEKNVIRRTSSSGRYLQKVRGGDEMGEEKEDQRRNKESQDEISSETDSSSPPFLPTSTSSTSLSSSIPPTLFSGAATTSSSLSSLADHVLPSKNIARITQDAVVSSTKLKVATENARPVDIPVDGMKVDVGIRGGNSNSSLQPVSRTMQSYNKRVLLKVT